MNEYSEVFRSLTNSSKQLGKVISPQLIEMQKTLRLFANKVDKMIMPIMAQISSTKYMEPLFKQFKKYIEQIEKAKANPDSVFNFFRYSHKLNNFHWTWPYGMNTDSMLLAIETIESEEDFDNWLIEYFDEEKLYEIITTYV